MLTPNNKGGYYTIDNADTPNPNTPSLPDFDSRASYRTRGARLKPTMGLLILFALPIFGVGLLAYAFIAPILAEWRFWVEDNRRLFDLLFFALVVGAAAAILFALYSIGRFFHIRAQQAAIVRLQNDFPVSVEDIQSGWQRPEATRVALWTLEAHYGVQGKWADNSGLRGLGQYAPTIQQAPATGATTLLAPADAAPLVVASSEWLSWLDRQPHVLLASETGGGKSTTAKAILAPRVNAGEAIFVIDPHSSDWFNLPSVGGGEDWREVRRAFEAVASEYQDRLQQRDDHKRDTGAELPVTHFQRLTVVLDEANNTRSALDTSKRGETSAWKTFAQALGSGARKVNISIVLLAQSANVEDLGLSGAMRENFTRIALDERTIKQLIAQEEMNAERRKALYAALVGRDFPAAAAMGGQVFILDRTGLDRVAVADARRCGWAGYDYAPMPSADTTPGGGAAEQSIGHSARDKAVIAMFARGLSYDAVRDNCKCLGLSVDQNRLPELRRIALEGLTESA